jgi:hypothetical protein
VPRNPKAAALRKAAIVHANWKKAGDSRDLLQANRKAAMVECVNAGCSKPEVAAVFEVTREYIYKVLQEMGEDVA